MTSIMRQKDIRPAPARIEFKGMKFLITDRPSDSNISNYITVNHSFCPCRLKNISFSLMLSFDFTGTDKKQRQHSCSCMRTKL